MKYSNGYKFQLKQTIVIQTTLRPDRGVCIPGFIFLDIDGLLYIYAGYAWDGCSFAPDLRCNLVAGVVHDALYQLIQTGLLDRKWKSESDWMLYHLMVAYGSPKALARIFYFAVDQFGYQFVIEPRRVLSVV